MLAQKLFKNWKKVEERFYEIENDKLIENKQSLTNDAFSEKWINYSKEEIAEQEKLFEFQKRWFLDLYGFDNENSLARHLSKFEWILDTGCGLGYKAAWFASLAPNSKVIGIDFSSASYVAYKKYKDIYSNLVFARGDIAKTKLPDNFSGFTVCDQVIMHTTNPRVTLKELSRITSENGEVCCYWYRKRSTKRTFR